MANKFRILDVNVGRGNVGVEVEIFDSNTTTPSFAPVRGFLNYTIAEIGVNPIGIIGTDCRDLLAKTTLARSALGKDYDVPA